MLVNNITEFRIDKQRTKKGYLSPKNEPSVFNSEFHLQHDYQDIKRPLRTNHSDLSFKGLSFSAYKQIEKVYSRKEFLEFTKKYLGRMGEELFEDITSKNASRTSNMISVDGDKITIFKKTIPHLAWDGIIYPFKILPADILNGTVELLGKVPFLKNWSAKTLELPLFKNIRQRSKIDAKVNSLVGLITYRDVKLENYAKSLGKKVSELTAEEIAKVDESMGSSVFQSAMKMFDPKTGNYDTKHERALNRLVSGLPPAIFLATDAYNLSRMMDDDKKEADKEMKTRFKQEVSRILSSGYLTLITMGAFQKFINSSKMGIVITTGTTVLITEMFSRLSNGKHITRLTPEEAREENRRLNTPEANIKPIEQTKGQVSSTGNSGAKTKEQQKPLLSFDTLMKASAVILGLGYGIKGIKNLPIVKKSALNYFNKMGSEQLQKLGIKDLKLENAVKTFEDKVLYRPFIKLYDDITSTRYIVDTHKFDEVISVLRKNGFIELADKYERVASKALSKEKGKKIFDFGLRDKVFKVFGKEISVKPFVNFVIAPFKFMWNTITLPYWMVDEKIMSVFRKTAPKSVNAGDLGALARSFEKISAKAQDLTSGKITSEQFKDFIQVNLLKAFNVDSLSSVSNAELSNLAKTAASIATIWFLMTDNYNMVMLKSNGNDKDGASTKFKERFVQEGSRLFYQTLLIDLFNSTFMKSYNGSLFGMSWVTLTDTTLGEMLTRSSVGIPIKPHTRQELIDIETEQNNSTGFKKKYYNFMQRLTGKRSIKSYEVDQKQLNNNGTAQATSIPSLNNPTLVFQSSNNIDKMIKKG